MCSSMFDGMATSIPLIKSGRIKAFAVSTPKRSPLLPDVPTFTELGYPQLETVAWMGLWVKPDTPAALQTQIREAALKALAAPGARERLQEVGFEPPQPRTPRRAERVAEGRLRPRRCGAEVDRLQAGIATLGPNGRVLDPLSLLPGRRVARRFVQTLRSRCRRRRRRRDAAGPAARSGDLGVRSGTLRLGRSASRSRHSIANAVPRAGHPPFQACPAWR